MRAFVVRHAQSGANVDALLSSALPGPPLSDLGHDQAREVAELLASSGVAHVYCSPLLRTRTTAAHIANRLGVEMTVLDDLREFSLGDWEGRSGTDQDVVDHPVFAAWLRRGSLHQRFQGGESATELQDRFTKCLERAEAEQRGKTVVLVTHGGLMAVAVPLAVRGVDGVSRIPANAEVWDLRHDGDAWTTATGGIPEPWSGEKTVSDG